MIEFFFGNRGEKAIQVAAKRLTRKKRLSDKDQETLKEAERNASAFQGYSVADPRYFAIGKLTLQNFPFERYQWAHELAKTNDVPAFIRSRLNLPSNMPVNSGQIETVMTEYTNAWNSGIR